MSDKRRCPKCGIEKPLTWFPRNRSKPSGYGYHCKKCNREAQAEYNKQHPDKIKAAQAKQKDRDPEVMTARNRLNHLETAVEAYDEYDL